MGFAHPRCRQTPDFQSWVASWPPACCACANSPVLYLPRAEIVTRNPAHQERQSSPGKGPEWRTMMHKQDDNAQVLARLAALKAMSVKELKAEWDKLFETEAPNNSRSFLEQRLAYRIQELTLGGPSKSVRQLLDALADEVEGKKVRKSEIGRASCRERVCQYV